MNDTFRQIVLSQFDAALTMLGECLDKCPDEYWDGIIGKYPFWHVAYHVLCFVDCYSATSDEAWKPQDGPGGIHPKGRRELEEEYPSRRFSREELIGYLVYGRTCVHRAIAAETSESLDGPSGFSWLKFSRAELHLYSLRHVQHHAGQLGAFLRRVGVDTAWTKTGWGRQ